MSAIVETASATWKGSFAGHGELRFADKSMPLSLPKEMGGTGAGVNPEQLLAAASASCLMITLGIVFDKAGVPYRGISGQGSAIMSSDLPPRVQELELVIDVRTSEPFTTILPLVERAKQICVIGRTLRSDLKTNLRFTVSSDDSALTPEFLEETSP